MDNTSKLIIQAILEKKPYDVKELVAEAITEKATKTINETQISFVDGNDEDDEDESSLREFFEEFHEEYGHLPEDEQLEIMKTIDEGYGSDDHTKNKGK